MRKFITKIICVLVAAVSVAGLLFAGACSKTVKLDGDYSSGEVSSNGGFAVEKGNYIYFINGSESNTAKNEDVLKGSIMRISKSDFSDRSYSRAEVVVPQIAYSGNYDSGIYIYGDYIYYSTPSVEKNSDGEVQNSYLAFKRTKLDGTDTTKTYFVQYSDNTIEYRYVEVDGTVYLMYVAKSEDLYGTEYTNLHSVNTSTGVNTLLAYNVSEVKFDSANLENPRVFYTMQVLDVSTKSAVTSYNQIYSVRADATERVEYDFSEAEDYDASKDPLFVNCGQLVYDGIGKVDGMTGKITPFNFKGDSAKNVNRSAYTYTLSDYLNGTLFYIRTSTQNDTKTLYCESESTLLSSSHDPVSGNLEYEKYLLRDGEGASNIRYVFKNGVLTEALIADESGLTKAKVVDGKLTDTPDSKNRFSLSKVASPTILFTAEHDGVNYIYYSVSGGNGYSVNRISADEDYDFYNKLPVEDDGDPVTIKILDLDSDSSWYKPELIDGQILFLSETDKMSDYSYVMACDLRVKGESKVMTNAQIKELNELYESVKEEIEKVDEEVYEGLKNLLNYGFYTNDGEYVDELIKAYVDIENYDEEHFWSKETISAYKAFIAATNAGAWKDFSQTVKVNGENVAANKRDYYYSVVGKMTEADEKALSDSLKSEYLQEMPVKEGWYDSLSKGEKAGFIIGICAAGLLLIAAAVVIPIIVVKRKKSRLNGAPLKRRIKVDTTDDLNVNVYEDETPQE